MIVLQILLLNSLIITGLYLACNYEYNDMSVDNDTKMIFWWFKNWACLNLPDWLYKPLIGCMICMASIHSTYIYWHFFDFSIHNLIQYPFYILALCGVNSFIKGLADV